MKKFFVWAGTHNKVITRNEALRPSLENAPDLMAELLEVMIDHNLITVEQALRMASSTADYREDY